MNWLVASIIWLLGLGAGWLTLDLQKHTENPYVKLFCLMVLVTLVQFNVFMTISGIRWWIYG